jgi:hypothetical protein
MHRLTLLSACPVIEQLAPIAGNGQSDPVVQCMAKGAFRCLHVDTRHLRSRHAAGKRLAEFVAATPPPVPKPSTKAVTGFAETSWRLVKFQSMDDTTLKPDDRSKYTIEFQAVGRLAVRIDCNHGTVPGKPRARA